MNTAIKNLILAWSAGLIIVLAAVLAVVPAQAQSTSQGYDVHQAGQVINVADWDRLNVRKWPAHYSQKIAEIPNGTVVYVERCIRRPHSSDWCKIGRDNAYGWVNSKFLMPISL